MPPCAVTVTLPDAPLIPGIAVIVVELTMLNEDAAVPPKLTPVVPEKFVPVIVIVVKSPIPLVGVNELMVGAGYHVNPLSVAVPSGVVTLTTPVDPPATTAVIVVALTTVYEEAGVPPKLTAEAPVKFVPVIVTVIPFPALTGVNDAIDNATVKLILTSPSPDFTPLSFDSRIWLGGKMQFAGVHNAKIVTFSGANNTAYIETGDIEVPGGTSSITMAKPIVDNGSGNVALLSRRLLNETTEFGAQTVADAENRVSIRGVGRYHRLQLTPTGNWKTTVGVDIELNGLGSR